MIISTKQLSNSDSESIVDLILPIQQVEFNVPVTLKDQPDLFDIDGVYHRSGGGFWGTLLQGELIGTIALINVGEGVGVIRKMFVKKEYRGKEYGVAQQLLESLISYSKEKGISDLYLGTFDKLQAAQRFYERNGFQKISEAELPGNFLRMAVDNTFYHLSISK